MSHTNVQIPKTMELERSSRQQVLEAELKFWRSQAEYLHRELENIPQAVEKYGYVDFPCGLKLVRCGPSE